MIRLRLGRVDARESSVPSILGILWQVCVRGDRQVAVVHGRQSEETSRFEAHKSSTPFSKPCPGCRYAWEVISEWQSRVGGDLGARLATAPAGGRAAAAAGSRPGGLQRHHSASCMTQLQAKHAHSEGSDGCAAGCSLMYYLTLCFRVHTLWDLNVHTCGALPTTFLTLLVPRGITSSRE